jgi:hypothetical protein
MPACIVAGLLVVCHASGANAQTVAGVMEKWGALGSWSTDCSRPPSQSGRLSYVPAAGGKVVHERDFGSSRDAFDILMAAAMPDGRLELFADFGPDGVRRWAWVKGPDGRIRTVENARIDGTAASIVNGRFLDGRETQWQSKCDQR